MRFFIGLLSLVFFIAIASAMVANKGRLLGAGKLNNGDSDDDNAGRNKRDVASGGLHKAIETPNDDSETFGHGKLNSGDYDDNGDSDDKADLGHAIAKRDVAIGGVHKAQGNKEGDRRGTRAKVNNGNPDDDGVDRTKRQAPDPDNNSDDSDDKADLGHAIAKRDVAIGGVHKAQGNNEGDGHGTRAKVNNGNPDDDGVDRTKRQAPDPDNNSDDSDHNADLGHAIAKRNVYSDSGSVDVDSDGDDSLYDF